MKKKSWADVQMAITAIAITITIGLWSMFSAPEREKALAKAKEDAAATAVPETTEVIEPTQAVVVVPTKMAFTPLKIIYGGTPPAPKPVAYVAGPSTSNTGNTTTTKKTKE